MQSGNTFRMRPDGSHVEQFTHGQVNPFGLAFDPLGNLYSADCHSKPLYMLLRGACYPSFGKPHDGLGFGPEICKHSHGSTGISGVVYYAADHFPPEYRDTVFIGNPITNRINHDRLERHGSTNTAVELPDFLSCDDRWFRPVDVCLGPDGALYIADFYNRIIGHYEVPLDHPGRDRERGRIWRVIYKGPPDKIVPPPALSRPDIDKWGLASLVDLLSSPNLQLRIFAVNHIVDRFGVEAAAPVRQLVASTGNANQRAFGLWILERLGKLDADLLKQRLSDPDALVRVHALKILAERSVWSGDDHTAVRDLLGNADAFVRRAAGDALARHPAIENVEPLLALWSETDAKDTQLVHATRMALRDQLLASGVLAQLQQRLDLKSESARRIAEVCLGAKTEDSASFVFPWLTGGPPGIGPRVADYAHHVARYLPQPRLAELYDYIAFRYTNFSTSGWHQPGTILALRRALQERGLQPPEHVIDMARRMSRRLIADKQETSARAGIDLAREFRLAELHPDLAHQTTRDAQHANLRTTALEACIAVDASQAIPLAVSLLNDSAEQFPIRQKAAQVLAGLQTDPAREALLGALKTAPERLSVEIAAGMAATKESADRLLTAMAEGKASPQLLSEPAVGIRLEFSQPPDLAERRAKLTAGLPPRDQKLRQIIDARREGFSKSMADVGAGEKVFLKTCAACHKLGEQGKKIGPELDGIAHRGLDRLLEDLLDPSRNVDQAFRSTAIATSDGRAINGLVLREEGQVLVLADAQGKELRVPLAEIDTRSIAPLSPMPANLVDVLSEPDFYHLLAFLLEQRQKPTP
jgi:putative heme-binding domain-containing protein